MDGRWNLEDGARESICEDGEYGIEYGWKMESGGWSEGEYLGRWRVKSLFYARADHESAIIFAGPRTNRHLKDSLMN